MKNITTLCATVLLLGAVDASGQDCRDLSATQAGISAESRQMLDTIKSDKPRTECGSLSTVWGSLMSSGRPGGRKLEEDRPYNPSQAQANYAQAQADPDVRQRLDQVGKEVSDGNLRLLYQAAILDEEGYYGARDMLVRQLRQQLK
ncbi:hypothetical protein D9M69_221010 [compost metagenome]